MSNNVTFFQLDGFPDTVCVPEQGVELLEGRDPLLVRGLRDVRLEGRLRLGLFADRGRGLVDHFVYRVENVDYLNIFSGFLICFYLVT